MTEAEWHRSDDASAMLDFLWQRSGLSPEGSRAGDDVIRALCRFYLASCRRIWPLLPQEDSRRGVEVAERYLAGEATAEQVNEYNWDTEMAAFRIEYAAVRGDAEAIAQWVAEVRALPAGELRAMLHPPETADEIEPRELLLRAAYFVDYAMFYPLYPEGPPPDRYRPFLSAEVLRRHVGYPGPAVGG